VSVPLPTVPARPPVAGEPDRPAQPTEYRQTRFRRPAGGTDLLLIRHGESAAAREGVPFPSVDGHSDPELHPDGRRQAEAIAERLAGEELAAIYVTSLRRTAETAAPLAARLGLTPVVEADLAEVKLGEWEGGELRRRVAQGDPLARRVFAEERWDLIPGAEPASAFSERVGGAVSRIAAAHRDAAVAVFAHQGVIGEILAQASRSRPFAFVTADNGSISHLVVHDGGWAVRRFNDTAHLTPSIIVRVNAGG
jgi:2,3-bisphosphoglycerate-dependent phosphoglycerate mutase